MSIAVRAGSEAAGFNGSLSPTSSARMSGSPEALASSNGYSHYVSASTGGSAASSVPSSTRVSTGAAFHPGSTSNDASASSSAAFKTSVERRERNKASQRESRKRKQDRMETLESENAALRKALADMKKFSHALSNGAGIRGADGAEVAPIQLTKFTGAFHLDLIESHLEDESAEAEWKGMIGHRFPAQTSSAQDWDGPAFGAASSASDSDEEHSREDAEGSANAATQADSTQASRSIKFEGPSSVADRKGQELARTVAARLASGQEGDLGDLAQPETPESRAELPLDGRGARVGALQAQGGVRGRGDPGQEPNLLVRIPGKAQGLAPSAQASTALAGRVLLRDRADVARVVARRRCVRWRVLRVQGELLPQVSLHGRRRDLARHEPLEEGTRRGSHPPMIALTVRILAPARCSQSVLPAHLRLSATVRTRLCPTFSARIASFASFPLSAFPNAATAGCACRRRSGWVGVAAARGRPAPTLSCAVLGEFARKANWLQDQANRRRAGDQHFAALKRTRVFEANFQGRISGAQCRIQQQQAALSINTSSRGARNPPPEIRSLRAGLHSDVVSAPERSSARVSSKAFGVCLPVSTPPVDCWHRSGVANQTARLDTCPPFRATTSAFILRPYTRGIIDTMSIPSVDVSSLKQRYEKAGQSHLFAFWDKLNADEQAQLAQQLDELDVERVNQVFHTAIKADEEARAGKSHDVQPPPPSSVVNTIHGEADPAKVEHFRTVGLDAIARGQVGVLLMAGGQGTRLGSTAPKGCYDIGLPSHKSLFQIQAERILRLQHLAAQHAHSSASGSSNGDSAAVVIPWYIMTSGPTRRDTEAFFAEHKYFGLQKENIIFFEQGTLPCLSLEGKILLDSTSRVATAPDGNGGLYRALRTPYNKGQPHTVISDLEQRGIKYLHAYGVDNCLVKVGDPIFLGVCLEQGVQAGVKVVKKENPKESVGVVALRDGKFGVVEYSEILKA
ncbi:hypothetical protein L1887_57500 [Cichorium endivia]|nr:hypothetical protein L1887_57500 [Cichorium endivia]